MATPCPPADALSVSPWLILSTAPELGAVGIRQLLNRFGSAAAVLAASTAQWRETNLTSATIAHLQNPDSTVLARAQTWLAQADCHLLTLESPDFPPGLRAEPTAPALLYVHGDVSLLSRPQLAIVGSRNPTPAGRNHAKAFARELASRGLCITSGLAAGIDTAAHQGALAAEGLTIAVAGTGLDQVYPAANRTLAETIARDGALVSEYPPGTGARRQHFPQRNRIIAGLALGTLVVEAAPRSGSLITARLALDLGREVFAMPGSVDNPLARGCHGLIRNGAKLVETAADVLEEIGPLLDNGGDSRTSHTTSPPPDTLPNDDYRQLLAHIDNAPVSLDALVAATGHSVETLSSMLLILELQGAVAVAPGGGYQRSASE